MEAHYTRRDRRHPVPPGVGFVEFRLGESRFLASMVNVSVAGMSIELEHDGEFHNDQRLPRSVVRVGECHVEGELLVKYFVPRDGGRTELGCLFYPASALAEEKWSAMVSVLQAAVAD